MELNLIKEMRILVYSNNLKVTYRLTFFLLPLVILLLTYCTNLSAQLQNSVWCFGYNIGIEFQSEPPTRFYSSINAFEGSATIADPNGHLLFYSDGKFIWDKNYLVMPNGSDLFGGSSSTQAAMIVPWPGSLTKYFVFTTQDHTTNGGVHYSIVDMQLNNGFGDVEPGLKNIDLLDHTSEKIAWAWHSNGVDIWILTHTLNSNEFYCFLLTAQGLQATPVVSAIGSIFSESAFAGPLKVSPSGKHIAVSSVDDKIIEMFDFDSSTGIISNFRNLNDHFKTPQVIYGIEFSPDESMLFLSTTIHPVDNVNIYYLYQLDWANGNIFIVNQNSNNIKFYGIQRAIDNRIYISRGYASSMDVVHHPDIFGPGCQYEESGFLFLEESFTRLGLPHTSPYSFYLPVSNLFGRDTLLCAGDSLELRIPISNPCAPDSILWSNGTSGLSIMVNAPGIYWVKIESPCGYTTDTIEVRYQTCEALVYYDMEACISYMHDGTNMDYSEFQATFPAPLGCADIAAGVVHRSPPQENKHSCTPGVNETVAMCVSSYPSCDYAPGHPASLVMEIQINPRADSVIGISGISFYEKSPASYSWINGPSGPNDPPGLYGLRILIDGIEAFRAETIPTHPEWTLQSFSFIGDSAFVLSDSSLLRIEMLPYCPGGNGAEVSAWDVDDIRLYGGCLSTSKKHPEISGHVYTRIGNPISGVDMMLSSDASFATFRRDTTDANGYYSFDELETGNAYYLKGYKDDDVLFGVSALDLVNLQKHLLGVSPLTGLIDYIAGDINHSAKLTVLDLIALQKALLGKTTGFPGNTSWRFGYMPQDMSGHDLSGFSELFSVESLDVDGIQVDFLGIKVGDLTGDARIHGFKK